MEMERLYLDGGPISVVVYRCPPCRWDAAEAAIRRGGEWAIRYDAVDDARCGIGWDAWAAGKRLTSAATRQEALCLLRMEALKRTGQPFIWHDPELPAPWEVWAGERLLGQFGTEREARAFRLRQAPGDG